MVSFAFVPVFEWLAFKVIWSTRLAPARHGRQWSDAVEAFLDGNRPWLVWLVVAMAVFAVVPPRAVGPWVRLAAISTIVPMAWSLRTDVRFFRSVLSRSARAAIADALMFRALAWTAGIAYFLGTAIGARLGL